jgi:hypothetical protein
LLSDLYEKRGDAYLNAGDFRRGTLDFRRIIKGIPSFAEGVDRWRLLGTIPSGDEYYIDVKTIEFPSSQHARLWLKTMEKNAAYRIESYEFDCKLRRLQLTSTTMYDAKGEAVTNVERNNGWQQIIPETQGEQLYNGMCPLVR